MNKLIQPTPVQPLAPPQLLQHLRDTLLNTFEAEFRAAAARRDQQAVSRFFRLWPEIDAKEQGLAAYSDFVVTLVHKRNPQEPHVLQLQAMLESIAHIIDQHQPVVEKYYGSMAPVVSRLVDCCQVDKIVESWEEVRHVGRLVRLIEVDGRDVDQVLTELVALGNRWALFRRFIADRVGIEVADRVIGNLLRVYYEPLEMWYLQTSIEKAHALDTPDENMSSVVDDVFYLFRLVLSRILQCGSLPTLQTLRSRVQSVIERDYCAVVAAKVDPADEMQALIYLNDLDTSADYMDRLVGDLQISSFVATEVDTAREELNKLSDTSLRQAAKTGLDRLFGQNLRPKLRPLLDDCYRDVTYVLDDEGFAEAEDADLVCKRFARAWQNLVDPYKALSDHNFSNLFNMLVDTLVRPWEKMVMGMRFTEVRFHISLLM